MGRIPKIMKQFYFPDSVFTPFNSTNILFSETFDITLDKLEKMYRDPDIERFVEMKAQWMALMVNGFEHPNKEIEEFVWNALNGTEGGLSNVLIDAFADNIVYGHHVSEIVWEAREGMLVPKRFVYIPPQDRTMIVDSKGDFVGIKLFNGAELKRDKLFYYNMRPNRGLFGKSRIASLYPYYLLLKTATYNYGRILERFGIPWAIGKSLDTEKMLELLKNMYNIASAAIDPEEEVSILEPKDTGEVFERAIDIALGAFIRHLGIPELMVNVKKTGTYNLGEVQYNSFMDEIESLARKQNQPLVGAIAKLVIKLNYGDVSDYGKFIVIKDANVESMKGYAAVLQMMNQAESLNDSIRSWLYERMGIPKEKMGLKVDNDG
ncbi:MAG: phage portal protein family protein [Candidatus Hodarchaeales archaeon]